MAACAEARLKKLVKAVNYATTDAARRKLLHTAPKGLPSASNRSHRQDVRLFFLGIVERTRQATDEVTIFEIMYCGDALLSPTKDLLEEA